MHREVVLQDRAVGVDHLVVPVHDREPAGRRVSLGPLPLTVVDQPSRQLARQLPVLLVAQRVHLGHDLEQVRLVRIGPAGRVVRLQLEQLLGLEPQLLDLRQVLAAEPRLEPDEDIRRPAGSFVLPERREAALDGSRELAVVLLPPPALRPVLVWHY